MVPLGAGVNGFLRWKELGIDGLLPIDEDAEKAVQAESARKMANGAPSQNPVAPTAQMPPGLDPSARQNGGDVTVDDEDDEEDEEGEDDEEEEEDEEEEASSEWPVTNMPQSDIPQHESSDGW